jgi:hypothetical protein
VKLYKKVITVYAWLEAGGTMAKVSEHLVYQIAMSDLKFLAAPQHLRPEFS